MVTYWANFQKLGYILFQHLVTLVSCYCCQSLPLPATFLEPILSFWFFIRVSFIYCCDHQVGKIKLYHSGSSFKVSTYLYLLPGCGKNETKQKIVRDWASFFQENVPLKNYLIMFFNYLFLADVNINSDLPTLIKKSLVILWTTNHLINLFK